MAFTTIVVDITEHVAVIRLNRPDALNALNAKLLGELGQALTEAEDNDKVRCIILTGSEKAFAAGADVTEMAEKSFIDVYKSDMFADEVAQIARPRKPIIAAVAGYALGGGCELAMMCDFIIAADTAKFGQPEINLGVIAGLGGTQRLNPFRWQIEGDGNASDGPIYGCGRGRARRSRQPRRSSEKADGRGDGGRREDRREIDAGHHGP